jgi:hypothetical protein
MLITLGFTESDRTRDYSSFIDGYRIGAQQVSVTTALEGAGTSRTAQQWAEAVFVASNAPSTSGHAFATTIRLALAQQAHGPLRSLFGDTVSVHGQMLACEPAVYRVNEPDPDAGSTCHE